MYLTRLVDDLLDASHVVNGRLALARRPVDAIAIVRDAVELVRPRAQQKAADSRR
jgi:signal transduction histidine kinase